MIDGIYGGCTSFLEVLIQFLFLEKLAGRKAAPLQLVCFIVFGCIVAKLPVSEALKAFFFLLVLIAGSVVILKMDRKRAVLHGVVAAEVMQLCFGIVNSASALGAPYLYPLAPAVWGRVFMIGGTLVALGLSCLCYAAVCKCVKQESAAGKQYVLMSLAPLLMVLTASSYISYELYGNVVTIDTDVRADLLGDGSILLVQAAGIISVLCVMYAYRKLTSQFCLDAKLAMLVQKANFQEQYVAQAQAHYDSTRALRHDIRNHLSVVKGLLSKGRVDQAKAYLGRLDEAAGQMAFPFRTGNPALDVLLENKFVLARRKGIVMEGFLKLPNPCFADEVDLCVIVANALDNAIDACGKMPAGMERVIRLSSRMQGEFLWIGIENSFCQEGHGQGKSHGGRIRQGTGLSNIKEAASRCGGKVDLRITDNMVCFSVMLLISQQPARISQQMH